MPFFVMKDQPMHIRYPIAEASFRGGMRDRLLLGLFIAALFLLLSMPLFSSFSMRDVTGVAMTYSLSVMSAIGLILTIFLGGSLVSRDIQSRTIYSVATLPVSRSRYLLEKYLGLVQLLSCSMTILGFLNFIGLSFLSRAYPPDKEIVWVNYFLCLFFELEKLLVLASVLMLFSAIATSSFLPMILTLAVYVVGTTTEKVKLYMETFKEAETLSPLVKMVVKYAYYIFPNLSHFDLKIQTVYSLPVAFSSAVAVFFYGIGYITIVICAASVIFKKRDLL